MASILNSAKEFHFYVMCREELNYADYIEKYIAGKECTLNFLKKYNFKLDTEHHFQLTLAAKALQYLL